MTDSLNLLVLLSTVSILFVLLRDNVPALLCFYATPLAVVSLVNAIHARGHLLGEPLKLRSAPLTIHVGLVFLAFALFFVASMTSAAYLFEAWRLKQHRIAQLLHRLPSLEQLDRTLCRLITYGYPFFVITLVLGIIWAWVDRDLLGPRWWLAPKVLLAGVMVIFYALTFLGIRSGRLRGVKLAYVVFLGFSALFLAYLVLAVTDLSTYNFWETKT